MKATSIFPLSLRQQGLLVDAYLNLSVRFKGELSVSALRRALAFIMKRHEALRMRVVRSEDQLQQFFVEPVDSYDLPVICVRNLAAVKERIKARLSTPTVLERDGPVRSELLSLSGDDHVLLLVIHIIAIDAYAEVLLIRELLISYDCYARSAEPIFPPAMRYSDYVLSEAESGERLSDAQLQYWRSALSGSRDPIPRRENSPTLCQGTFRVITSSISSTETQRLQEFSSGANVSLAAVVYAIIFLSVLGLYSSDDIIATVAYSGRDSRVLQTLGGRTVRVFWLRMIVNRKLSLAEFARKMQSEFICGAIASRASFTPARAIEQALGGTPSETNGSGEKRIVQQRIKLVITDAMIIRRELESSVSNVFSERIILDPRVHDGLKLDGADTPLTIMLRRDLAVETGRPLTFVGMFNTRVIDEGEVFRLLETMCSISRLACLENQALAIDQVARATARLSNESRDIT